MSVFGERALILTSKALKPKPHLKDISSDVVSGF